MDLNPGDKIKRTLLHEQYGGQGQGGISTPKETPNVFLFSDPTTGVQHGYVDGWQSDGHFHYTGEGQRNDQQMIKGNLAVRDHKTNGKAVHLFDGSKNVVTYVSELRLADDEPWYQTDAPETNDGPTRKVIVFRLLPVGTSAPDAVSPISEVLAGPVVTTVDVEANNTEKTWTNPKAEPIEAERREAVLVHAYRSHLISLGRSAGRRKVVPPGEHKPLFTDLHDDVLDVLIEAKGTVTREAVRMALGQLIDYGRFVHATHRAVLLPEQPRPDLLALAATQGVAVIWRTMTGFEATTPEVL